MAVHALRAGTSGPAPSPCFGVGRRRRDGPFELADLRPEIQEHEVAPHAHEDAHFVLVLDGAYISSAAGAPPVSHGPLLVYNPPGTVHRDRFRGDGRFVAIGCLAADDMAGLPPVPICLNGAALRAARGAAARIGADGADEVDGVDLAGLCWELLAAAAAGSAGAERRPSWLLEAREMIDDGFGRPLRLAEVAGAVGVHPVHLARVFRSAFGCTPSDYQAFARLKRARALIAGTGLPLAEIALSAGFADQSHFTRAFSRRFGLAPGAFRAAIGNVAIRQDAVAASSETEAFDPSR